MTQHVKNARKTRGKPFQRGNPGRPKGARNKRTILVEQIMARLFAPFHARYQAAREARCREIEETPVDDAAWEEELLWREQVERDWTRNAALREPRLVGQPACPKAIAASKRALNSVREPSAAALMRADVTRR
jgi:hypothetical protein